MHENAPENAARPVILVVDDVEDNRVLVSRRLGRKGFTVLEADSGAAALEQVAQQRVDLVLLDVMMPGMAGDQVLARLRERYTAQELAIIMVTARDASSEIAGALDAGANDYVTKPIDFKILEARINAQLRQAQATPGMQDGVSREVANGDGELLDGLTGLLTRRNFEEKISRCLVNARRANASHAVAVLNIDDFRLVNAAYGQSAGDRVLQDVAELLRDFAGGEDEVARLGGAEFGLLLYNCDGRVARRRLRELRKSLRERKTWWRDAPITTTASFGVVLVGAQDASVSEVLRAAALSCEAAKQVGKDQLRIYDKGDGSVSAIQRQADWAVKLQQALREDALVLFAQPIVSTSARFAGPVSYEILVRMLDDGKLVSPFYFLSAAEAHGLMPQLDRWVIERALAMMGEAQASSAFNPERICINLSGQSLTSERFLRAVEQILPRSDVAMERICFEITETVAIQRIEQARKFIDLFREEGVAFALDDFGSGVSSFGYLRDLPVDSVKIDGQFVKQIGSSPIDRAIVSAVNEIAHVLGKKTVAEFVETEEAVTELASLSVDQLQGYHIGCPAPFEEVIASAGTGARRGKAV